MLRACDQHHAAYKPPATNTRDRKAYKSAGPTTGSGKTPKLDSALYAFYEALKLYKQLGNDERAGIASENTGTIYIHRGEETSVLTHLLEAKALFEATEAMHRFPAVYQAG